MPVLTVNGKIIDTADYGAGPKKLLLDFLRDDLRLTGAKDGCSEGACGACTVIVDGRASRACVFDLERLNGRSVVTIEALSEREKAVYDYAFAECGAVQCGFCIPGMVMSAKALLDVNGDPSPADVKKAINGNICRCTGYVKIERAILLAAGLFKAGGPVPADRSDGKLDTGLHRLDAREKTLGYGVYTDDMAFPDMVYGKALRAKYPRARVIRIDASKARAHPDALCVLTADDVPGHNKIGHLVADWDVLIPEGENTRYIGDALALAASADKYKLREILDLIEVEYEVLTPIENPVQALAEGAPKLHEKGNLLYHIHLKRGDAAAAIESAAHAVTNRFSTPFTEHAFMEPECCVAMPDGPYGIMLYTGGQSVYDEQHAVSQVLGLPAEFVRVRSNLVGGGFGGKEDMSVQHHAALLAWHLKRPVKVKLTRQESINIHPKRHAMEIDMTAACDADGRLVGMRAEIVSDTGAYASLGGPVLQRACTHAGGPYNYANIDVEGKAVYTNNPPGGAFRGFGVSQTAFAIETSLNMLAEKAGISPWEIRFLNAVRPGDALPNGQLVDQCASLVKCLEAVKPAFERSPRAGLACAFKNSGLGVGVPDYGRCIISIQKHGGKHMLHIRTSAACVGQGMATVCASICCEALDIPAGLIVVERPDTLRCPDSGTTTASRQTVFTGEAVRIASMRIKEELDRGKTLASLEDREFYGEYVGITDIIGSDKLNPESHVAYSYAAQVVDLDEAGRVSKVTAAYDIGRVINRKSAEGQIEGGVVMGLGYALTEDFPLINCAPSVKYGTLGLIRASAAPEIETIIMKPDEYSQLAYGAKGVGELATIPTAPAAAHAYRRYDGVFRASLPLKRTFYKKG